MPEIPLYSRRATPTTEVAGAPMSGASEFGAIAQLGGQIAQIGVEYSARKRQLKEKADVSDYEVSRRLFESDLEQKKNDALMSGVHYSKVYDEIVVPEISRFNEELGERGYSDESLTSIRERWGVDSASIAQREINSREQMELTDYVDRRQSEAEMLLSEGQEDSANEIYSELAGIVGENRAGDMRSVGQYNLYTIDLQKADELAADGLISDDEYFNSIKEIRDEVESSDMNANHKRSIQITANAKVLNFKGKRVRAKDKGFNEFKKLRQRDEVTAESLEDIERTMGKHWSDAFESTIRSAVSVKATSDKDIEKAYQAVLDYQNGKISAGKALLRAEKAKGQYAEMSVYLIGRLSEEKAQNSGHIVAYDDNWNGVPSKVTSSTSDFVETLGYYMATQPEGKRAGYFASKFMAYDKWRDENPDASQEDYEIWRNEMFKIDAESFVQGISAPQAPQPIEAGAVPSVNTQEEYDALPSGSRYIHPDGSTRVKK